MTTQTPSPIRGNGKPLWDSPVGGATPGSEPIRGWNFAGFPRRLVRRRPIEQTLFFQLLSLAIVAYFVPYTTNALHGLVGFLPLIGIIMVVGMAQNRFGEFLRLISRGFTANKPLVLLYLWYATGVFLNCILRGNGWADWRLMLGPVVELGMVLFAFALLQDDRRLRWFQIALTLGWGAQSLLSVPVIVSGNVNVREVVSVTGGAWIYGNQAIFAGIAMVLPVMLWRALRETRIMRLLLLGCSSLTIAVVSTATFATPVGLFGIGICVALLLSLAIARSVSPLRRRLPIMAMLVVVGFIGYQATLNLPKLNSVRSRLKNVTLDPRSGGYEGVAILDSRWIHAEISIQSFLESPLLGGGGGHVRYSPMGGGHSSLLDTLGVYGLLGGGGALMGLVALLTANAISQFRRFRSWQTLAGLTAVVLLVVGGIVNPYWEGGEIPLVLLMARPFLRP